MGATSDLEFCWICFLVLASIRLWKVKKKLTFHFPDSRCLRRFAASPLKKNYQHDTPLHNSVDDNLVGGFNPFEKNYWNHQPVYNYWIMVFFCSLLPATHFESMESHLRIQGTASKILDLSPTWAHQWISKAEIGSAPYWGDLKRR